MNRALILLTLTMTALCSTVSASDYDTWIHDLAGNDDARRTVARQMLPREGMRTVPDLIELLHHEDQRVWRTAKNILSDIGHAVTVPGFETERSDLTQRYLNTLEDAPEHTAIALLRLLGVVAPEGADLSRYHSYFGEKTYRSEVIDSLVVMKTQSAIDILLRQRTREKGEGVIELSHALDTLGFEGTKRATSFESLDAQLAHIETLIKNGGNWDTGIDAYKSLLQNSSDKSARAASVYGLCRYGDAAAVDVALGYVKSDPSLEASALMGLDYGHSRELFELLLDHFLSSSRDMQLGLLGVFGRKQHPAFLEVLLADAANDDADYRAMAFEGLTRSQLPGGVNAVISHVRSLPEDDRKFEIEALLSYSDSLAHQGARSEAGKAYLALYETTDNPEFKDIAFQGIKAFPSEEAYELILSELDIDDLSEVPTETLIALNVMIDPAQHPEAAEALSASLKNISKSTKNVQSILDLARQQGAEQEFARRLGFVTAWHLIGPFPWNKADGFAANPVNAPDIDLDGQFLAGTILEQWRLKETGYVVNAHAFFGPVVEKSLFAYTTFESKTARAIEIRVGSDDGVRIWLNEELVHENDVDRGMVLDEDIVPVQLAEGTNRLLLQVTQGGGGWSFMLRLTEADGTPIDMSL